MQHLLATAVFRVGIVPLRRWLLIDIASENETEAGKPVEIAKDLRGNPFKPG